MHCGVFNQSLIVARTLTCASISISICVVAMFTGTPLASLHSWKEGCSFKRFHSVTRFQTFADSGTPACRCHLKGRLYRNRSVSLDVKNLHCVHSPCDGTFQPITGHFSESACSYWLLYVVLFSYKWRRHKLTGCWNKWRPLCSKTWRQILSAGDTVSRLESSWDWQV